MNDMLFEMRRWLPALAALLIAIALPAGAEPIVPTRDDEVVDVLPAVSGDRAGARRLRRALAATPDDPALALAAARAYLDQARALGDPRFAGMALAAIAPWPDAAKMPDAVLMMHATLQQYLHEFDASAAELQRLIARPGNPRPQAWLTLATVRRVQGRYADSDTACRGVAQAGAALYASACLAENAGLRGRVDEARGQFSRLLANPRDPASIQAWLTTSRAELEQRAGRPAEAEAAFRRSLALDADPYTTLAFADLLIEQKRPEEALRLLADQTRSEAVLLRLAIAGTMAGAASATVDVQEMRDRIALANERPETMILHGREQAMFALAVDHDAALALRLARGDVAHQREPLDLLVFAQAARAGHDAAALQEVTQIVRDIGLVDQRIEALL